MPIDMHQKWSSIYAAAAIGDMAVLSCHKSESGSYVTPGAKNTILHVYIIAQSRGKDEGQHFLTTIAQMLLKSPCINNESPSDKATAAAKNVENMLDLCLSLLWKVNAAEDTPLHMAARHGQDAIAKVLIERAKREKRDVESGGPMVWKMLHMVNKGKETALHQAVRYKHGAVVQHLVCEDDPDHKYLPNEDGETPLYMTIERRANFDLVKNIVEHYNSPAYQGPHGTTALHVAGSLRSRAACEAIVGKRELRFLTREVDERGRTPLHYGGIYLLKSDKSAAYVLDKEGKTALHVLAGKGYDWMVREFVKECPECLEVEDSRGRNALHYAVESGSIDTVEVILKSEYMGDLLKKKDKDGLTPLHLLALKRFYMPNLINDPRLDAMAFNAKELTPNDIILTTSAHSRIDMQLDEIMKKAGIEPGWRSLTRSESNINNNDSNQTDTNKVITKPSIIDEDNLKEERQNHLVVAALIATVTFAAGFTLPGGYNQDEPDIGQAVLTKETAFQAFVIFNTLAMMLSSVAVFIHLLIAMNKKKRAEVSKDRPRGKIEEMMVAMLNPEILDFMSKTATKKKMMAKFEGKMEVTDLFSKALPITLIAIVAMVLAFIAGTYAVLSNARVLAFVACAMGSLFFGLFWYLWKELFTLSKNALKWAVLILCMLVFVLCGLVVIITTPICWACVYLRRHVFDPIRSTVRSFTS